MKNLSSKTLNFIVIGLTLLGMVAGNKLQEKEMQELKDEIKLELKHEKEK